MIMNTKNIKDKENICLKDLKLPEDLKKLNLQQCQDVCKEIRSTLIHTVSKTGGHLASNLGTVELTLAIHRVFASPADKIVWDVGHQAYTHKILTGRLEKFHTLRQENGISGYPKPSESEHDSFISGHSSTSISVACGFAEAMRIQEKNNHAIAVIGDGAFTGGLAYEGLNNAAKNNVNLIVILNHNDMSISKNVGAFANYLRTIRNTESYVNTKNTVEKVLKNTPVVGDPISKALVLSKTALKRAVVKKSTMFEDLGYIYLGPVDGHNIQHLEEVLKIAKSYHRPVFVHVNTVKGKGYMPAERNPGEYHGISKFDINTGNPEVVAEDSFSSVFGLELTKLARNDKNICAVTAAMKYGTGLQYFSSEHRERYFDVGIAEQHAVTFSAGLATMGLIPVFAVYSSFLQRAYDQLIHDASISKLHIVIAIDRAGVVGEDGETHQGVFDIPMLTSIPGVVIYSPSSYASLKSCLNQAIYEDKGLVCVRYPRGNEKNTFDNTEINTEYKFYKNESSVSNVLIITYGRLVNEVEKAKDDLSKQNISCDILKLTKVFPLNEDVITKSLKYKNIIFFEECMENGGISEHFLNELCKHNYIGKYSHKGIKNFVKHASVSCTLVNLGLDHCSMLKFIKEKLSEV